MSQLEPTMIEITDEQRAQLIAHFTEHPDSGYKVPVRAVGRATNDPRLARATQAEAEKICTGDEDIAAHILRALKIDEPSLVMALGKIASDPEHRDQFRAITWGLGAFHGLHDQSSRVELTGPGGAPIEFEDRSASLADVARVLEAVGALAEISSRPARPELPAAPDVLAEPRQG